MDIDEDDDLYVPEEPKIDNVEDKKQPARVDDLEEGEEEDEGGAMDEDDSDSVSAHASFIPKRGPLF
jgi:pre-mRNA 3'-end-processing factor FIP1